MTSPISQPVSAPVLNLERLTEKQKELAGSVLGWLEHSEEGPLDPLRASELHGDSEVVRRLWSYIYTRGCTEFPADRIHRFDQIVRNVDLST